MEHTGSGQKRDRAGKGRQTSPSPSGDFGTQRRDRGRVARGDDRSYSPPPPEEASHRSHRPIKRVRPGTNERDEPPFQWTEDRRGGAESRRHGSSEDRSRSLTPAMMEEDADSDWLVAEEEEEERVTMERRRGPPRADWGSGGGGGGRSRNGAGDRERQRYEVRMSTVMYILLHYYMPACACLPNTVKFTRLVRT